MLSNQQIKQDLQQLRSIVADMKAPGSPLEVTTASINGQELPVFARVETSLRDVYLKGLAVADKDFLVYLDERYSFRKTLELAEGMAQTLLQEYGIKKGERVAICSRNNPEWCMAFMAVTMIGAVAVPMNSWWKGPEIQYGLQDSGARLLFADQQRLEELGPLMEELDLDIISIRPENGEFPEFLQLARAGQQDKQEDLDALGVDVDDDATIIYTSGSTGSPKGVLSTQRNIINALYSWLFVKTAIETLRPELRVENPEYDEAILSNVPLFHVTGCHAQFLLSFVYLRKFVMMYKWNPEQALSLIEKERITVLHGVPTMTWEVMNSPAFDTTDLSSLHTVQSGGAARPPGHLALMQKKFSDRVQPGLGYGLTETNAIGATITGAFYLSKPDSTGRPTAPLTSIKIIDEQGSILDAGEIGEICIRGATVMKSYWNRPGDTADSLKDGWFHTGDIGLLDEHGFLVIKDRAKDIVIRGGENVACAEVEYALNEHPQVHEAAVYGLPDERLGEIVCATVMIDPGSDTDQATLQAFLKDHLAAYKVPALIRIQEHQLQRIASGKIAKKALRDEALAAMLAG